MRVPFSNRFWRAYLFKKILKDVFYHGRVASKVIQEALSRLFRVILKITHPAGEPPLLLKFRRDGMGLGLMYQLKPVLQTPEEKISLLQVGGLSRPDQLQSGQLIEGGERRRGPQKEVVSSVKQLEGLDKIFDVPNAAFV